MKRIILIPLTIAIVGACIFFFTGFSKPVEIHEIGIHTKLLDSQLNSYEIHTYCDDNNLDYEKIVFYEAEFSVFNRGNFYGKTTLPIFNPDTIKSILAVYSSMPIDLNRTNSSDLYRLELDSKWLEKQPIGEFIEPLKIKYVMQISDLSELPSQDLISQAQSKQIIQNVVDFSNLKPVKEVADDIRKKMPINLQDNLKSVVSEYCLWIKKNISYPAEK